MADDSRASAIGTTGRKLRRVRDRLGLTQVEMARRVGVSASYLNLIEHDQRRFTAKLLRRFCKMLDLEERELADDDENEITARLTEMLVDPIFVADAIDPAEISAAVRVSPAVGGAMLRLYHAYRGQRDRAGELGETLRQRDALTAVNYEFRTLVTSIRSLAEILADNPELDAAQRRQFLGIVVENSKRLVPLFGDLLDAGATTDVSVAGGGPPPNEEVADFWQTNGGYFEELETAADEIRKTAGIDGAADYERLAGALRSRHGVVCRIAPVEVPRIASQEDDGRPWFDIPEMLSLEARNLAVAKCLAAEGCRDIIARRCATARWASPDARNLTGDSLAEYLAGAILMPYDGFRAAAHDLRHDIERLQRRFGVSCEQVCRRLTALKRPGAKGVPFHIVKVDMAGNVTWRLGSSGFRVPRYGGTCPLWNVHSAFLAPGVIRTQLSRMPDGATYLSIARTIRSEQPQMGSPCLSAIEIGCDASFAGAIVYADGLDLSAHAAAVPVGVTCRLCERQECTQRVLPPFGQRTKLAAETPASTGG